MKHSHRFVTIPLMIYITMHFIYETHLTYKNVGSQSLEQLKLNLRSRRGDKIVCDEWGRSKNIWILETKYSRIRNRNLCAVESVARRMPDYCVRFAFLVVPTVFHFSSQ